MSATPADAAPTARRPGAAGLAAAALLVGLALCESTNALVAPSRAPVDADWRAAATFVDAGFAPGDLVVAAPAWADPVLRQHLGHRLPAKVAGRLDHERFSRVWELSQRAAEAPEVAGARLAETRDFGNLRVRRFERTALVPTYDFTDRWADATVSRTHGGVATPCERQAGQHQCPGGPTDAVRPAILEIGNGLRHGLFVHPIAGGAVALEYRDVRLGRELAVAGGLHHVWLRKYGAGVVRLRVLVDGREIGALNSGNRTGWKVARFDTRALAGKTATVRFEVTADNPHSRHFGFSAEARG